MSLPRGLGSPLLYKSEDGKESKASEKYFLVSQIIDVEPNCKDLTKFVACVADEKCVYTAFKSKALALRYADFIADVSRAGDHLKAYAPILEVVLKPTAKLSSSYVNIMVGVAEMLSFPSYSVSRAQVQSISNIIYRAGEGTVDHSVDHQDLRWNFKTGHFEQRHVRWTFNCYEAEVPIGKTQEFIEGTIGKKSLNTPS